LALAERVLNVSGSRNNTVREDLGAYDAHDNQADRARFSPWPPLPLTRRLLSDLRAAYRLMEMEE
jgi:hypothetical protein